MRFHYFGIFALGIIVGAVGTYGVLIKLVASEPAGHSAELSELVTMVSALKHIRIGETNAAVQVLEIGVDGGLVTLTATRETNATWLSTNAQFRIVGNYRLDYPHSIGDATSDKHVTDFLTNTLKKIPRVK